VSYHNHTPESVGAYIVKDEYKIKFFLNSTETGESIGVLEEFGSPVTCRRRSIIYEQVSNKDLKGD
jgi:hypothetical protein